MPTHNPPPPGPRLAVKQQTPSSSASNLRPTISSRSPRSSPNVLRSDRASALPTEALLYHTPTRANSAMGEDLFRRPSSTTPSNSSDRPSSRQNGTTTRSQEASSTPMFFHASDAKLMRSTPQSKVKQPPTSSAKFFYADSRSSNPSTPTPPASKLDLSPITAPPTLSPLAPTIGRSHTFSVVDKKDSNVKFLRANGMEDGNSQKSSRLRATSPQRTTPVVKPTPRVMGTPLSTSPTKQITDSAYLQPAQQSQSPVPTSPSAPSSRPPSRPHVSNTQSHSRRSSVDMSSRRHSRANSTNAFPFPDVVNKGLLDVRNNSSKMDDGAHSPRSPTVPIHAQPNAAMLIEQQKELALNARRERKVLDLEISNASLLAINKTLERRMRKQTNELRRFRRLSRSGRLALAPTKSKRRSTDDQIIPGGETIDNDDRSENDEGEEEEEEDEEDEEEDEEDEDDDPSKPQTEKALARRAKDEKRLANDLAKHQALLDASAKMNASLKRCQFVMEALIEEGRKSLAYVVRPSEVKLGGRVVESETEAETDDEDDIGDQHTTDGYSTPTHQESDFEGRSSQYSQSEFDENNGGDYSHSEAEDRSQYSYSENDYSEVSDNDGSSGVGENYSVSPPLTPR